MLDSAIRQLAGILANSVLSTTIRIMRVTNEFGVRFSALLILCVFLVSCGGGGSAPPDSPPDATLISLQLSGATLEQPYGPGRTDYTAVVGFLVPSIQIGALTTDPAATVMVNGQPLAASGMFVPLFERDNVITVVVTATDGTTQRSYTITVTRQSAEAFAQDTYIKASNSGAGDHFGLSIALSGNTLVVGAHHESSAAVGINGDQTDNSAEVSGAVYVFVRDDSGTWSQQAYIKASNTEAHDWFGSSVAIEGDTLAVGAIHEHSSATGIDGDQSNNDGPGSGAVYIYRRNEGIWSQEAYVKASQNSASGFGVSMGLSSDSLAVGSRGYVYVFARDSAGIEYLGAADIPVGNSADDPLLERHLQNAVQAALGRFKTPRHILMLDDFPRVRRAKPNRRALGDMMAAHVATMGSFEK